MMDDEMKAMHAISRALAVADRQARAALERAQVKVVAVLADLDGPTKERVTVWAKSKLAVLAQPQNGSSGE